MARNPVSYALRFLFNLKECKDNEENTIETVRKDVPFVGTNLWLLVFAIFVASIGLNINSTAVIIGAMLISPLMGPIVGAGLALGINDFDLFKKSLMNLGIATIIGIIVSTIYFSISPLQEAQSELLARTAPNIYDVLIALFGGLSGIIGTSRREKGNVIPGVAIATALMSPLCTAGYGMATGQYRYLFGAFYLYLINCTFICLSAFVMVKYLRFHSVSFVDERYAKRIRVIIGVMVSIMVLPALYFAWEVVQRNSFNAKANSFITRYFPANEYSIIMKNLVYNGRDSSTIELAFLTRLFSKQEQDSLQQLMRKEGLGKTKLIIRQNLQQLTSTDLKAVIDQINLGSIRLGNLEDRVSKYSMLSGEDASILLDEVRVIDTGFNRLQAGYLTRTALDLNGRKKSDSVYIVLLYANSGRAISSTSFEKAKRIIQMRMMKDSIEVMMPGDMRSEIPK